MAEPQNEPDYQTILKRKLQMEAVNTLATTPYADLHPLDQAVKGLIHELDASGGKLLKAKGEQACRYIMKKFCFSTSM